MGMPLELNTMIVTKGKEQKSSEKEFMLIKEGYRLYPLDIPIELRVTKEGEPVCLVKIKKLQWEKEQTTIIYEPVNDLDV